MIALLARRFIIGAVVLVVIFAAVTGVWLSRENVHEVIPEVLYRSGQLPADRLAELITRHDIKTVINLRGANPAKSWYIDERETSARLGVKHHDIDFSALVLPRIVELHKLIALLRNAEQPILVHCRNGSDRAGLASAIMLLLDGAYDIDDVQRQTSLRYRVTKSASTGKQFLAQYRNWLESISQRHSASRFLDWVDRHYVDAMGNMRFYTEGINNIAISQDDETRLKDGYAFELSGDRFHARGWAFDLRNQSVIKKVAAVLDDRVLPQTRYGIPRKAVADFFGIAAIENSGWEIAATLTDWPRGCYDMKLRLTRLDDSVWQSPAQAKVCLQ